MEPKNDAAVSAGDDALLVDEFANSSDAELSW